MTLWEDTKYMQKSLFQNDPIISMLFKTVSNSNLTRKYSGDEFLFSATYVRSFLENIGIAETFIRKIINELFKDIAFLESLHKRIKNIKNNHKAKELALYYLAKLQKQTAETIARKILRDDNSNNFGAKKVLRRSLS